MDENTKLLKKLHAGQIVTSVFLIIVFLLLIGNLIAVIYMGVQLKTFVDMVEPAITMLSKLDVDELNKTLYTLNNAVDVFKIDEALEAIGKIDFDGFSRVVSGIDVDKLNKTLEKIDDATQFMKRIGDGMNNFLNQFGINFAK